MQDCTLYYTLKSQRGLCINFAGAAYGRRVLGNMFCQQSTQIFYVNRARTEYLRSGGIVEHSQQQMLDRNELVPLLSRFNERHV
jgi:hypothetical protein